MVIFAIFYAMKSEKLQHWLSGDLGQHPVDYRAVETAKHLLSSETASSAQADFFQ
jgi:hypothetical protein